jgi:hypothetical protein
VPDLLTRSPLRPSSKRPFDSLEDVPIPASPIPVSKKVKYVPAGDVEAPWDPAFEYSQLFTSEVDWTQIANAGREPPSRQPSSLSNGSAQLVTPEEGFTHLGPVDELQQGSSPLPVPSGDKEVDSEERYQEQVLSSVVDMYYAQYLNSLGQDEQVQEQQATPPLAAPVDQALAALESALVPLPLSCEAIDKAFDSLP